MSAPASREKFLRDWNIDVHPDIVREFDAVLADVRRRALEPFSDWHSLCVNCGPNVGLDEDGLCATCGATATGDWLDEFRAKGGGR
jgi:hypothetical protein